MLDILTDGFRNAKLKLKGQTTLTEENVNDAIMIIRRSLLDADVEYGIAKAFLNRVKNEALGETVKLAAGKGASRVRVSASDHFIQICQRELEELMGPANPELNLPNNRPGTIMMVGLQGSGKTTTTGKVAKYIIDNHKKRPLLVAADIYRPAAVQQLKVLGERLGVPVFHQEGKSPVEICRSAIKEAYNLQCDAIILDTAGRLTIDETLMQELADIKAATSPDEILLVCDAMMGQDAVTTAKSFDERLNLSGSIITKLDGDARGGAALTIKQITGKPIKFLGLGEDLDKLELFRPEGLASRILGMGDVLGLMQDFERVAEEDHQKDALKMLKGEFSYLDFYKQIQMIQKMGSLKDVMAKLPMQDMLPKDANVDDRELVKIKAMIDSMTTKEKIGLTQLSQSRMERIAKGSGRNTKDILELAKKFSAMRKMMSTFGKNMGGLLNKIPGMGGLNQLNNMRKMASSMQNGASGGMPGLPGGMGDLASMFGGGGGGAAPKKVIDREKQKKLRKAEKNARKKNRKR